MRISQALVCVCLALVLIAPRAGAQEQAQDESPVERARIGLEPSAELEQRKRERAKEGSLGVDVARDVRSGIRLQHLRDTQQRGDTAREPG